MFAVGLIILVALSVYISRKRLNLAVLGIGVVRRWVLLSTVNVTPARFRYTDGFQKPIIFELVGFFHHRTSSKFCRYFLRSIFSGHQLYCLHTNYCHWPALIWTSLLPSAASLWVTTPSGSSSFLCPSCSSVQLLSSSPELASCNLSRVPFCKRFHSAPCPRQTSRTFVLAF